MAPAAGRLRAVRLYLRANGGLGARAAAPHKTASQRPGWKGAAPLGLTRRPPSRRQEHFFRAAPGRRCVRRCVRANSLQKFLFNLYSPCSRRKGGPGRRSGRGHVLRSFPGVLHVKGRSLAVYSSSIHLIADQTLQNNA